ncbi:phosphotransferase family protein [Peribacillus sp. SCS-37]|uniref:phosphotransferase family protein n=1 Tax=Paraperibacillus esterisolvens TaxID=3115296 RepID=UPI00390624F1
MRQPELAEELKNSLESDYGWEVHSIQASGQGVENIVFAVIEKNKGLFAVRTPYPAGEQSEERMAEGRASLEKEFQLCRHCAGNGIPAPLMHFLHLSPEISYLVTEFMVGDEKAIPDKDIGTLARRIHKIPVEGIPAFSHSRNTASHIALRISRRLEQLRKKGNTLPDFLPVKKLESMLAEDKTETALLHLDLRPANIIGCNGKIKALFDWDNALIGSPALELMRIFECGELAANAFLKGYGSTDFLRQIPETALLLYRLDAALMLAVVFLVDLKEEEKGKISLSRVKELIYEVRGLAI